LGKIALQSDWNRGLTQSSQPITASNSKINGASVTSSFYVSIQTGFLPGATGFIFAYSPTFNGLYGAVPGAAACTSSTCPSGYYGNGESSPLYYIFPCTTAAVLQVTFGENVFTLPFNMGPVPGNGGYCFGSLVALDLGLNAWIMGAGPMSGFYSVFDVQNERMAFAQLV